MIRRSQKWKIASQTALFLFFLTGILISAHFHYDGGASSSHPECSICQVSHSSSKFIAPALGVKPCDLKPVARIFIPTRSVLSYFLPSIVSIRGPPCLVV